MNEQLQAALAELLKTANSGINAGATFLSAELPGVIKQLLQWQLFENIVIAILAALCIPLGIYFARLALRNYKVEHPKKWAEREEAKYLAPGTAAFLVLAFSIPMTLAASMNAAKILIAPKVYLVEYAAKLAGEKK
jgi:H+/Cl- antiporter ClcA